MTLFIKFGIAFRQNHSMVLDESKLELFEIHLIMVRKVENKQIFDRIISLRVLKLNTDNRNRSNIKVYASF